MSTNEYGLDTSYMAGKLKIFLRDIERHTPDEAARVLARLAVVADAKVLRESEFSERDTYRELCGDLLEALRSAKKTAEFEKHPFRGWHKQADEAITKAETILGEKK